jgi:hypothetical protein
MEMDPKWITFDFLFYIPRIPTIPHVHLFHFRIVCIFDYFSPSSVKSKLTLETASIKYQDEIIHIARKNQLGQL